MNPYRLDTPAIVSFSGGRTSGFMLRQILDAFGGTLPDDVRVVFCNTGLEHAATYDFVREVSEQWAVPITWLEYRVGPSFAIVDHATAARDGEPFAALIGTRNYLPNPVTRFCTVELKLQTSYRFMRSVGWDEYTNAIGLRADEPWRIARLRGDRKAEHCVAPMALAGHTLEDVRRFWEVQSFDLRLPHIAFGNCQGCFLKGRGSLLRVFRNAPDAAAWWIAQEARPLSSRPSGARFRNDRPPYAALLDLAQRQGELFTDEGDTMPCACTD